MDLRMLGTFEVVGDVSVLTPSAPKLRVVLALLAMRANQVVHTSQLVEELWEDRPPVSSSTTLQTYIYQLRKLLALPEFGGAAALHTRPNGYVLVVPSAAIDVRRFEAHAERGAGELRQGHVEAAAESLRAALEVWRGPALSDVTFGSVLQAEVVQIEERRNAVLEMHLDADLMLGRYQALISELTGLLAHNPTHEGLCGRLMLALYRAGRRSESLRAFQRVRATLSSELGLEPGPDLQRIHQAILSSEPMLGGYSAKPAASITASSSIRSVEPPAQLPPAVALVGRAAELARMQRLLLDRSTAAPTTVSVTGAPGIGTSSVCVAAAHGVRSAFPDGQFFARLDDTGDPGTVLADFLHAAGIPSTDIPAGLNARSALFRSWSADRKVLVVLDDVSCTSQLVPLLASGSGCATLVATHRRLAHHAITASVALDPLSPEHALELLMSGVGRERIEQDNDAANALIQCCGGLPLPLRAAATRLALRPHWRVRQLTDRLTTETGRLQELATEKLDIRDSVDRRYRLLTPASGAALRRIAAHTRHPAAIEWVAVLLGIEEHTAEAILEHAVEVQLADVETGTATDGSDAFRYRVHPLVRLAIRALDEAEGGRAARQLTVAPDRRSGRSAPTLASAAARFAVPQTAAHVAAAR